MSDLKTTATQIRRDILRMVHGANSGHPGGSLGCADFFTALFFKVMNHNKYFSTIKRSYFSGLLQHSCKSRIFWKKRMGNFPKNKLPFTRPPCNPRTSSGHSYRIRIAWAGNECSHWRCTYQKVKQRKFDRLFFTRRWGVGWRTGLGSNHVCRAS